MERLLLHHKNLSHIYHLDRPTLSCRHGVATSACCFQGLNSASAHPQGKPRACNIQSFHINPHLYKLSYFTRQRVSVPGWWQFGSKHGCCMQRLTNTAEPQIKSDGSGEQEVCLCVILLSSAALPRVQKMTARSSDHISCWSAHLLSHPLLSTLFSCSSSVVAFNNVRLYNNRRSSELTNIQTFYVTLNALVCVDQPCMCVCAHGSYCRIYYLWHQKCIGLALEVQETQRMLIIYFLPHLFGRFVTLRCNRRSVCSFFLLAVFKVNHSNVPSDSKSDQWNRRVLTVMIGTDFFSCWHMQTDFYVTLR